MIPIWVFVISCIVFIGILANEYRKNKELKNNLETVEYYLDLYVNKYGPTIPVTLTKEGEEGIRGGNIKQ